METFVAILFIGVGTTLLVISAWDAADVIASRRWQQTRGVIMVADLQRSRDSDSSPTYRAEIGYRYTVGEREFVATRARFGDRVYLSWSKPALRLLRKYRVGTEVEVHFNPNEPSEAVLEPGLSGLVLAGLAFGSVFVAMGVLVLRFTGS